VRAEHVGPFLSSAFEILSQVAEARPQRGSPVLRSGPTASTREMTAVVALEGDLMGVFLCSMSLATAAKLQRVTAEVLEQAGSENRMMIAAELARLICGTGTGRLEQQGCHVTPAPPILVEGFGEPLTTVGPILVVPLFTEYGDIDLGLALQPADTLAPHTVLITARQGSRHDPRAHYPTLSLAEEDEAAGAREEDVA
jgi:CheY-specific phosphatase CheX